jgi:hypothetical protein
MERIICAAIKCNNEVYCGYRHNNVYKQFRFFKPNESQEGFITTENGRFLTRKEAWEIADKAGQIINRDDGVIGTLFSENLY